MQTQENMSDCGELSRTKDKVIEGDESKLVPVTESIRYRKRAQGAEKKVEDLTAQLCQREKEALMLSEQLDNLRSEQQLTKKLIAAGTVDVESAVLLVKTRMQEQKDLDVDELIEQLKEDKQFLFKNSSKNVTTMKTSGAKDHTTDVYANLANAARKAADSGSRRDLQEYLKVRRNYL